MTRRPIEVRPEDLDLSRWIRRGDRIVWGQGPAEPLTLIEHLIDQRSIIGGARVFLTVSFSTALQARHADYLTFQGLGGLGTNGRLTEAGVLDPYPAHFSHFCRNIANGSFPIDVAFVQLAGPDSTGNYSPGVDHSYTHDAMARARVVIAEVNQMVPLTDTEWPVRPHDIDVIVHSDRPLSQIPKVEPDNIDWRIAEFVSQFVVDGSTIEVGIGNGPSAVLQNLHHHRDLGIHTGMFSDSLIHLITSGAVTNKHKPIDTGKSTGSALFLSAKLQEIAHSLPISLRPSRETLDAATLARLPRFTAINTAVQVDLTGQVNAEYAAGRYVGGVGGHVDYVRGARSSRGGRSITVLRSRTSRGIPRIVPRLDGCVVTVARSDVDIIVTEWGAAELANLTLKERARRLTAIAHPDDREALEAAWKAIAGGF